MMQGLILTFDDWYCENWLKIDKELSRYGWKATFFVTRVKPEHLPILKALQDRGHEIGNHTLDHTNVLEYIQDHSIEAYLENEVLPLNKILADAGIEVESFSYPFGARNEATDAVLLQHFKILRATKAPEDTHCAHPFYEDDRILMALHMGSREPNKRQIRNVLQQAHREGRRVSIYGHEILEAMGLLTEICQFANKANMPFLRVKDL